MKEKIRCINEKGQVVRIPENLTKMPDYMRRHNLRVDNIDPMEIAKPLAEVNFELNTSEKAEEIDVIQNFSEEETKEHYWAILDEKGIKYNKNFGIAKLKELCQ